MKSPHTATIIALRQTNPKMTLRAMGKKVGLHHEKVRQILKREGLSTNTRLVLFCLCGQRQSRHRPYCSTACQQAAAAERHAKTLVTICCEVCGTPRQYNRKVVAARRRSGNSSYRFCSRSCTSHWIGKTYGWGAQQVKKTHCKWGHSLADAYRSTAKNGKIHRQCRPCTKAAQYQYRQAKNNK